MCVLCLRLEKMFQVVRDRVSKIFIEIVYESRRDFEANTQTSVNCNEKHLLMLQPLWSCRIAFLHRPDRIDVVYFLREPYMYMVTSVFSHTDSSKF